MLTLLPLEGRKALQYVGAAILGAIIGWSAFEVSPAPELIGSRVELAENGVASQTLSLEPQDADHAR